MRRKTQQAQINQLFQFNESCLTQGEVIDRYKDLTSRANPDLVES